MEFLSKLIFAAIREPVVGLALLVCANAKHIEVERHNLLGLFIDLRDDAVNTKLTLSIQS